MHVAARPKHQAQPISPTRTGDPWLLLGAILVVLATLAAYSPALRAGFIWDDETYITGNELLKDAPGLARIWFHPGATPQYYPLVHTTFWLEHHLWGLSPAGYHATNILLHAVAALLLWAALRKLAVPGAFLIAAIFALHPVHVESVAWATERKNVLSGVFYFAALLAYLRFAGLDATRTVKPGAIRFYLLALLFFACALLSKTVTCSLPAAILLILWWKRDRITWRDIRPLIPMFAMGLALGLVTAWLEKHHVGAAGTEWNLTLIDRCLIAGRVLWFYAAKLVWPANLTFIYPRWQINSNAAIQYLFPAAAIAVIAALWLTRKRIGRGPLVAVLFFAGTLAPALGFINVYPMRYSFVADHFQYLASIGLIALVVGSVTGLLQPVVAARKPVVIAFPALVLVTLAVLTWRQSRIYANLETLWTDTLAANPSAWIAHNNLGVIRANQGRTDDALAHYTRVLELKPDHPEAHNNLAVILANQGKTDVALQHLTDALRYKPDYLEASNNLGNLLTQTGQLDKAADTYERALQLMPDCAQLHYNLADTLSLQAKPDDAIAHFQQALKLAPNMAQAHAGIARILAKRNDVARAIDHYRQSLDTQPNDAQSWSELAAIYARVDRPDDARACYERAVQLSPNLATAHNGLGILAARQGDLNGAADRFQQALQIDPGNAEAHFNLANLLAQNGRHADALPHYREALRLRPASSTVANRFAWLLATSSDPAVRNAAEAVRLAETICPAADCKSSELLDTLAAAYAAAGRFTDAAQTAAKAVDAAQTANRPELRDRIASRLALYRQNHPAPPDSRQ